MIVLLAVVGVALVVFGALVTLKFPDRPGGDLRIIGIEVRSPAAGLPLIVLGVAAIGMAASRAETRGGGGDGGGGAPGRVLTVYSSLPQRIPDGSEHSNKRSVDMENAISLALKQADGKAGRFQVRYVPLDATNDRGSSRRRRSSATRGAPQTMPTRPSISGTSARRPASCRSRSSATRRCRRSRPRAPGWG